MTRYSGLQIGRVLWVVAMVPLALANRYLLVPRLRRQAPALTLLRRATAAEIVLGVVAVALVAIFSGLDPYG